MFNRRKSVDQIVSNFTKAVEELDVEANRLREEAADDDAEAARLLVAADEKLNEANRATTIRGRLSELLGA